MLVLVQCAGKLEQFFEHFCQPLLQSYATCPTSHLPHLGGGGWSKIASNLANLGSKRKLVDKRVGKVGQDDQDCKMTKIASNLAFDQDCHKYHDGSPK